MATTLNPPKAPAEKRLAPAPSDDGRSRDLSAATLIAFGLLIVTGLIALFGGYLFIASGLKAERDQDVLYDEIRTSLAQATVPVSAPIAAGTPLGVLSIPGLGVEQVFVEGSASEQTMSGPGLKTDSVLPCQAGVSVLVGRRATFGRPFADLDQVHTGDQILVTTGQGQCAYVVDMVRTSDAPATSIQSVPARLTLVTSDPALTPTRTLVVSARLSGDALPASTGSTASADEQPGEGSSGRGVALLLWSQLLLLATGVVTWASLRVPGRAVWIGATPVLLAILWKVFENLAVLLPNIL